MQFEQLWRATTVAARGQEFDSTLLIGIAIGSALTLFTVFIILSFHIDRLYLPPKQPTSDRLYRPPPTAVAACSDETQHVDGGGRGGRRALAAPDGPLFLTYLGPSSEAGGVGMAAGLRHEAQLGAGAGAGASGTGF